MALPQLTDEQIQNWSREQKDRWWFENVFRGDMPQLTLRSGITGFLLGGILASTNLYVGAKSGSTLGVGLTSVILAFAFYKVMARVSLGRFGVVVGGIPVRAFLKIMALFVPAKTMSKLWPAQDFTILENNAMQSIATAAGYMTSPFISSLAAYMLITGVIVPWWQMMLWCIVISITGVLVAFPMKRRFINEDQLPFPEGRACGVVLDTLYTGEGNTGMFKAKVLAIAAGLAALAQMLMGTGWMKLIQFKILRLSGDSGPKAGALWQINDTISDYYYTLAAKFHWWLPKVFGTDARDLGLNVMFDLSMIGVGGLMGLRIAASMLLGMIINYVFLAPWMLRTGDIKFVDGNLGYRLIMSQWALWWAVSIMVVGSIVALFSKPKMIFGAFAKFAKSFRKKTPAEKARARELAQADVLKPIELPLWISFVGVPVLSLLGASMAHWFFGASWVLSLAAIPLICVLSVIAINSMALTSWTPTGALSKITQFTMGALHPVGGAGSSIVTAGGVEQLSGVALANAATNLSTAGMTSEVAGNAANLLSDIKPGYMLGAKPRQQAIGHVIGIFAGALASVPLFFALFLPKNEAGVRVVDTLVSDKFGMPAAKQWEGVARLIARGIGSLPPSVLWAMAIAGVAALVFEVLRMVTKGKFPLSAVSIGLGVVLPPPATMCMFAGALFFWGMGRIYRTPKTTGNVIWVESVEPICAGLITGAALIGIGDAIILNVLPIW